MTHSQREPTQKLAEIVQSLLLSFGRSALKDEVLLQTRQRRGAPTKKDWSLLHGQLQEDARKLLNGEFFREVSDASVARRFTRENPMPQSTRAANRRRIRRKLAQKRDLYVLYSAALISEQESPWLLHLKALETLIAVDGALQTVWEELLTSAEARLVEYRELLGGLPNTMSFSELDEHLRKAAPKGIEPLSPERT